MKSIFEYDDYKRYLNAVEQQRSQFQRGFRTRLAEALSCQNAYISQVLNTDAHFGLEHGLKIVEFLGLTENEKRYFLLLIQLARAGSKDLEQYFRREVDELRTKNLSLKERIATAHALTPAAQATYYSHWMYAAIHMLAMLKTHRTAQSILDALKLPSEAIRSAILFLVQTGLLIEKKGELHPGPTQIHLGKDSPQIRQHHTNWRIAAIDSLAHIERDDIHYSTVSTLSMQDCEKIKAQLVQMIENYVKTVESSKEETLYGFNLDFYHLLRK
jgi:uncharacterized protein (TIGR02147 family)